MIETPLTKGKVAIIDDEDYELVSKYTWFYDGRDAVHHVYKKGKCVEHLTIKKLVLGIRERKFIYHINKDKLDYRKENLSLSYPWFSKEITKGKKNKTSKYMGVRWNSLAKKWVVETKFNYKTQYWGYYDDEEVAARVYDSVAKQRYLNFPTEA